MPNSCCNFSSYSHDCCNLTLTSSSGVINVSLVGATVFQSPNGSIVIKGANGSGAHLAPGLLTVEEIQAMITECNCTTTINSSCEEPVYVEMCNFDLGIEGDLSPTEYCTPDCDPIFICKIVDEETLEASFVPHVWEEGSSTLVPYDGPRLTCSECRQVCDPYVADYLGTAVTSNEEPFNKINVYLPNKCCSVQVTTSAGTFTVVGGTNKCLEFDCLLDPSVSVASSDPACLASMITTIQRTK